ncbi:hypothetical protein BXZ70DRAFT_1034254 [Cristinia sonorae]|uniref:Uncharacterized protein n=1 Tax=Cristinia sonorae TaxID=1940300 RepID=A0A8K0UJK1_9AGAR|nr:hypothetical protein BXZ70DRAFT_1034254 [Cristinia sonorae]
MDAGGISAHGVELCRVIDRGQEAVRTWLLPALKAYWEDARKDIRPCHAKCGENDDNGAPSGLNIHTDTRRTHHAIISEVQDAYIWCPHPTSHAKSPNVPCRSECAGNAGIEMIVHLGQLGFRFCFTQQLSLSWTIGDLRWMIILGRRRANFGKKKVRACARSGAYPHGFGWGQKGHTGKSLPTSRGDHITRALQDGFPKIQDARRRWKKGPACLYTIGVLFRLQTPGGKNLLVKTAVWRHRDLISLGESGLADETFRTVEQGCNVTWGKRCDLMEEQRVDEGRTSVGFVRSKLCGAELSWRREDRNLDIFNRNNRWEWRVSNFSCELVRNSAALRGPVSGIRAVAEEVGRIGEDH